MGNTLGTLTGILRSLHLTFNALHMVVNRRVRSWDPVWEIPPCTLMGKRDSNYGAVATRNFNIHSRACRLLA